MYKNIVFIDDFIINEPQNDKVIISSQHFVYIRDFIL